MKKPKYKFIQLHTGEIVKIICKYAPNDDGFIYEYKHKNGETGYITIDDNKPYKLLK